MTAAPILVIRLGALSEFVQTFGAFAAIRARHRRARIVLLTTPPFAGLARRSPWFDEVWDDGRPAWSSPPAMLRLARRLRGAGFARVYDLQTAGRSARYRWMVGRSADWPDIEPAPPPDLDWLDADLSVLALPPRFCLLVPGASPRRPGKRWPAALFAAFAASSPLPCVVLGGAAEADLAEWIAAAAPGSISLAGRTGLAEIAALARRAEFALGNDTGPTHLIAAAGCPTLALFGGDSDPALRAPRGPAVAVLRQVPLASLGLDEVRAALAALSP